MEDNKTNFKSILVIYQLVYVVVMLWLLPLLSISEMMNAAITAAMTVGSALLIGTTFIKERERGNGRRCLALLSLCALVTVYVLNECGLYA